MRCIKDENIFQSIVFKEDEAESHMFIADDIGYIRPSKLKEGEIEGIIEKFKNTKGVIIDNRYYPSPFGIGEFIEYAMTKEIEFIRFSIPSIKYPGQLILEDSLVVGSADIRDKFGYYKGVVVGIINEDSMSQQETLAMAIRVAPKGIIIGSPSVGANTNENGNNIVGTSIF